MLLFSAVAVKKRSVITYAGGRQCVGMVISGVCDAYKSVYVCVRALKEKRIELLTPSLVHIYSMARFQRKLILRTKGQRSKVKFTRLSDALPAWVCRSIRLLRFLVVSQPSTMRVKHTVILVFFKQ